jgi:nucleoid-associated protein Lsr2
MARKISRLVVCDFPHDKMLEGTESMTFAFNGSAYEIDLCGTHGREFSEKIGGYVQYARRVRVNGRPPTAKAAPNREKGADIREWARMLGLEIKDRGRLRKSVVAAYEAEH